MKVIKNYGQAGFALALLLVFAFMLMLNIMTPLFNDDYVYSLNLKLEEPLTGFVDILRSISNFRSLHNGRIAAHFFAQLFLWLPKTVFNIVNAAVFALLIYSICRYVSKDSHDRSAGTVLAAFAIIWLLMPGFGHGMLWLTGSCSYLWAITLISYFVYPYFAYYCLDSGEDMRIKPGVEVLAVLYAFFVGAYSENGSLSALAICFCFLLLIFIKERKVPVNLILRFVVGCGGFLFLMFSPSELGKKNKGVSGEMFPLLGRFGITGEIFITLVIAILLVGGLSLWGVLKHRKKFCGAMAICSGTATVLLTALLAARSAAEAEGILPKINMVVSDTKTCLVLLAGVYFMLLMLTLRESRDMKKILAAVVLGIGAIFSVVIFLVASYFPARGVCVAAVYITIADLTLFSLLKAQTGKCWPRLAAGLVAVLFCVTVPAALADIKTVYVQFGERMEAISYAQNHGIEKLHLEPLTATGKYSVVWQGETADYYYAMQAFFGIDSITIEGATGF